MNLKRFLAGRPWAIAESTLAALRANAETKADAPKAAIPTSSKPETATVQMVNGVAVIPMKGVILRSYDPELDYYMGGVCGCDELQAAFKQAFEAKPRAIIIDCDSPGGTVSGVPETASMLYELRQQSQAPVIAVVDGGCCASAAYWIAAQCDQIIVSEGSEVGSVGVIATFYDFNRAVRNAGVDPYTFRSDDIKGAGGDGYQDAHGREIQAQVARYTAMFRDAVKRGRNLDTTDARCLVGADAVAAGYADEVGTMQQVLAKYGKA